LPGKEGMVKRRFDPIPNLNDGDSFILKIINCEEWKKSDPETFDSFIDYCILSNDKKTHFLVEFKKGI
jgi:hypothetical protein